MSAEHLRSEQVAGLAARFPHFDPAACSALFGDDQTGTHRVPQQGDFPAVRMANGAHWFYVRERRPLGEPDGRGQRPSMKVKAPAGTRHLLVCNPTAAEMLVVEGEGHGVALASIGYHGGIVVAGGTKALLSNKGEARARRENIFRGRAVRILYDTDEPGRAAAVRAARAVLDAGAARVAVLRPEWDPGVDVEDWLAGFPDRERALGALLALTGSATWTTDEELRGEEGDARPTFVQSQVVAGRDGARYLAVTVWDRAANVARLAVIGADPERTPRPVQSVGHEEIVTAGSGWALLEQWTFEGATYAPDLRGDMLKQVRDRQIIMPAAPADYGTSEALWEDVRAFISRWVAVESRYYNVLVAYVFMTYRLRDAGFEYVPYLRFYGPPGTGKGRALVIMQELAYRGLATKPTRGNLHRVVDFYGDATLVLDEFHLDRGFKREYNEEIIDLLNQGNKLNEALPRVEEVRGERVIRTFTIFGPKIMAGYGSDEHEALARRSIAIEMGDVEVPDAMKLFALPDEFHSDAYDLRARLLGWRGAKLRLGRPDHGDRHKELLSVAGYEVGQVFWPLVEMVPESLPDALRDVLACAAGRRAATVASRHAGVDAHYIEALLSMWREGRTHALAKPENWGGPGTRLVATREIADRLYMHGPQGQRDVVAALRRLGLVHARPRTADGDQISGIIVDPAAPEVARAMRRYGLEWPPQTDGREAAL